MTHSEAGRLGGRPRALNYDELRSQKLLTEIKTKEVGSSRNIKVLKQAFKKRMESKAK
jgi:hypothetical protein